MSGMIKKTRSEKIINVVNYIVLALLMLCIIIPMLSVVGASFVSAAEIARRGEFIIIPQKWDTSSYQMVFRSANIWRGFRNTLCLVAVGTTTSMISTICLAYPLSKKKMRGRNFLMSMVFFTMIFSGGTVPTYLLVSNLHMVDTFWALFLPSLINTWNMLLMRNFFYSVPDALEEAALLDGANQAQILVRVVLPLSLSSIVTITMFYAVSYWNAWWPGVLYLNSNRLMPIQNIIRGIVDAANAAQSDLDVSAMSDDYVMPPTHALKCATIVVGTIPILCVYPFIQKYFVKGVMVGSVKG